MTSFANIAANTTISYFFANSRKLYKFFPPRIVNRNRHKKLDNIRFEYSAIKAIQYSPWTINGVIPRLWYSLKVTLSTPRYLYGSHRLYDQNKVSCILTSRKKRKELPIIHEALLKHSIVEMSTFPTFVIWDNRIRIALEECRMTLHCVDKYRNRNCIQMSMQI